MYYFRPTQFKKDENSLIEEIDGLLSKKEIQAVIKNTLYLRFESIRSAFIEIEDAGAVIATGIFDETGKALDSVNFSNLNYKDSESMHESDPAGKPGYCYWH